MALMITLPSYCGRSSVRVDWYDYPNATEGCCCNECQTISACRRAWMDENGDYIPTIARLSAVPSDDPWYVRP